MGLISVNDITDGTAADAEDVNANINTIADEINGNISNANIDNDAGILGTKIADETVDTDQLTDRAVTSLKLDATVAFRGILDTGLSGQPTSTWFDITFDNEEYDYGNDFDISTGTFTAPVDGIYNFSWCVGLGNSNQRILTSLYKNSTTYIARTADIDSAGNRTAHGAADVKLDADDTVIVRCWQDTGTTVIATGANDITWFAGHLVGNLT